MKNERFGTYNERYSATTVQIDPYGRHALGAGQEYIALASAPVPRVQLICDGDATTLWQASAMPARGNQRFIRNPYSVPIEVELLKDFGAPNLVQQPDIQAPAFAAKTFATFTSRKAETDNHTEKTGYLAMAKRGRFLVEIDMLDGMFGMLITGASLDFLAALPANMLTWNPSSLPVRSDGSGNHQLTHLAGPYTDAKMAAWIAAAQFKGSLKTVYKDTPKASFVIDQKTAFIVFGLPNEPFEAKAKFWELGDDDHSRFK